MTIDDIINRPTWMNDANCQGVPRNVFYPSQGGDTSVPKAICRECDVQAECLTYAINNHEMFGIWGGKSERERRAIRRKYGITSERASEAECGTNAGYHRHQREHTAACEPCRQAHTADVTEGKRRRQEAVA